MSRLIYIAFVYLIIQAIRGIDKSERYRKSQLLALLVSVSVLLYGLLVLTTNSALSEEIKNVTYDAYVENAAVLEDQMVSIQGLTVWRYDTTDDNYTTIYAYEKSQGNMFSLISFPFDSLFWYENGDAIIGIYPEIYSVLPVKSRLVLQPTNTIEKLVKGDAISIFGVGKGMTDDGNPLILTLLVWIDP